MLEQARRGSVGSNDVKHLWVGWIQTHVRGGCAGAAERALQLKHLTVKHQDPNSGLQNPCNGPWAWQLTCSSSLRKDEDPCTKQVASKHIYTDEVWV